MPIPEDEAQSLRRRADSDQREAIRTLIAHTQQLDQRQTRLESTLSDWGNHLIRFEGVQQAMQQQIITLIESQSRTSQQIVGHMESEEKVWCLIQSTAEKLASIERSLSNHAGLAGGQIDNIKTVIGGIVIVLGSMAASAIAFAGYVMTRLHNQ